MLPRRSPGVPTGVLPFATLLAPLASASASASARVADTVADSGHVRVDTPSSTLSIRSSVLYAARA